MNGSYAKYKIVKRNGNLEDFQPEKIKIAIRKSAERVMIKFTPEAEERVVKIVWSYVESGTGNLDVSQLHNCVEMALEQVNPLVAKSYRDYRNYKKEFVYVLSKVYGKAQKITLAEEKETIDPEDTLIVTQQNLVYRALNKELYKKFFLSKEEIEACEEGYIYVHNMDSRRDTIDCSLFDMASILKGGFTLNNIWHEEPDTLEEAFSLMGDIIIQATSLQYGGLTIPEIDSLFLPYAKKSYQKYLSEYQDFFKNENGFGNKEDYAHKKVEAECFKSYARLEYKLNSFSYVHKKDAIVTLSFGLEEDIMGKMITQNILKAHIKGFGKKNFTRPTILPKLVFLYDKNLHGKKKKLEKNFELALECSAKTMYPDYLSLSGKGYVPEMYKKYKRVVSPMSCRAILLPWYEKGGRKPIDNKDQPIFIGRFSIGVVTLNLPMILAKAREEQKDFWAILDYYLEMIRKIHLRTYQYLGKRKASTNPLAFCEGGFYQGNLKPNDAIEPLLKSATASFGITALNELQELYNGKSLVEDGEFALQTMAYICKKVDEFKDKDEKLYAIYATPAEKLCGLQVEQFRKKYGIIEKVSSRNFVTNSFHCGVWEDITGIEKQDLEERFWDFFSGGGIQYIRYNINYNKKAMRTYIERAMEKGFYEGVNLSLSYCEKCGYEALDMDVCPKCGSDDLVKIERINGYLAYSRVHGKLRLNPAKAAEISERKSM